jgi:serine/threonine-protein kinase
MCRVRMGVHTMLDLPVAIKYLRPEFRCPMLARSLQWEARAAAVLRHPAIVRILDWGLVSPDDAYIVMERLEGEEFRDYLDREGPLEPARAIRMLLPICGGMAVAHARGVVHRDLKPENIILVRDDAGRLQPKILDFGMANHAVEHKIREGSGASAMGTLGYMPPEQAFGLDAIDHRTDIWAFCAVVYESLSDTLPFPGDTLDTTQRALVEEEVASLATMMGIDAELWTILERGLRKEPSERWTSMRELGQELARWLLSKGIYDDICGSSLIAEWLRPWTPAPFDAVLAPTAILPPSGDTFVRPTPLPFPLVKARSRKNGREADPYGRARSDLVRSIQRASFAKPAWKS